MITTILSAVIFTLAANAQGNQRIENWRTAPDVVSFQPFSETTTKTVTLAPGKMADLQLISLNKEINSWFILKAKFGRQEYIYNFENNLPSSQKITLANNGELTITTKDGEQNCNVLGTQITDGEFDKAVRTRSPYTMICEFRLSVKTQQDGNRSTFENLVNGIRSTGGIGESFLDWVKENQYNEADQVFGTEDKDASDSHAGAEAPTAALVSSRVAIKNHGLSVKSKEDNQSMVAGQWYEAKNYENVYVSVMRPNLVKEDILKSYTDRVSSLDGSGSNSRGESGALAVFMAMDLSKYLVAFDNGSEHPGTGWSPRPSGIRRGNDDRNGPDGFNTLAPLAFPGVLNPKDLPAVIGTFAGGFQRKHAAFKSGDLTSFNKGHHYGVMEKGVIMSTIVPNLSSLITYKDGTVDIKTWTLADNANLDKIKDIRQNGVPLIEDGVPGRYVNNWGAGNWSGNADAQLRTPRTAACIVENNGRRFLIISYFSGHSPSAMTRVLQSYQCKNAIHLDMNSPRFAYAALFTRNDRGFFDIETLHSSMAGESVSGQGEKAPRSIIQPTYKDFFYIMKKNVWRQNQ